MFRRSLSCGILILCLALPGGVFAEDAKLGFINMRKVFYEYKKTKDFNKKLEAEDEKAKEEIDKKTKNIKKLRDKIDLLSEEARAKKEPELRDKIKELDEYRKEKVEGFIREKDEMFKEIREDILAVTGEYAKKNEYNIVFDEAVFVYASEKYELTDDILKELNK